MRELQNEHNAKKILQLTSDTLILIDKNGICRDVDIHSDLWFLQEKILLNKNILKLLPKHTLLKIYPAFLRVIQDKQKTTRNYRLDLQGETYYFKCIMQPFNDMVLCQYRDITKRSNVKMKLERANHELKEIQKVAHIGQWKYNTIDNFVYFKGFTNVICTETIQSLPLSTYVNELIVEDDRLVFSEWLENNIIRKENDNIGYRIKYNDNIYYLRLQTYLKEELPDGHFSFEGYVQNVTDIQRHRNDINILTHAINNAKESIYAAKKDGGMVFANRAFRQQNRVPDKVDLNQLKIYDLVDDIPTIEEWKNRYSKIEPGKFVEFITHNPFKHEPNILAFEGTLYHVTRDDGESTYWSFAHDITERLKYESQIKQLNRIMDTVMENLPAGIVVKDVENEYRYLYRNRESFNISTEITGDENPIGKNDFDFFPKEVADKKLAEDIKLSNSGFSIHRIEERKDINGNSIILDKRKIKVEGKDFNPIIISIEWNITEIETMRRQLEIAKEKAEKSDKLKSAFLANMSHEIRTPLNAIVGFSRIIAESDDREERIGYYEIIDANNERLLHLINEILDLSKIESGIMDFNYSSIHLYKLCKDVFHAHTFKVPENVELFFDSSDKILNIESDKNRLFQILSNLIGNAIKFTSKGYIKYGYYQQQDKVYFYVEDTGTGISEDKIDDVFGRFIKLDDNIQGTGLGLSICESIIQRLGGDISVESELGKGTRFTFWIPISQDKSLSTLNNSYQNQVNNIVNINAPALMTNYQTKQHTILIGEEEDNHYQDLELLLSNQYNLIRANNGMEVVTMYDDINPDIILMKMELSVLSGIEAIKIVRQLSETIPIIGFSSNSDDNIKLNAIENGCNDFINTSNNNINLNSIIHKYLQ